MDVGSTYTDVAVGNLVGGSNHVDVRGNGDDCLGLSSEIAVCHGSLVLGHGLERREMLIAGRRSTAFCNGELIDGSGSGGGSQEDDGADELVDKHCE